MKRGPTKISKTPFSKIAVVNVTVELFVSATTTLPVKDGEPMECKTNIPVKVQISTPRNYVDILEGKEALDKKTIDMIKQALWPIAQIAQKILLSTQKSSEGDDNKQLPLFVKK